DKTEGISLFGAVNIFSEIETCAREIVRMCREENLRYKEIAVTVRDLQSYERLIEVIFADYGIPCFLDRKKGIINHPLVRLILSMLDIFIENWSYNSVFQYLKTGLAGICRSDIDLIENYVLECGIRGNRWTSQVDWQAAREIVADEREGNENQSAMQRINNIRREITEPLKKFRSETKKHKKVSDLCGILYDFLCEIKVPEKIEEMIADFEKENLLSMSDEYSQVWNIAMQVLDQVVEVAGDKTLGMERFSDMLKIGFGEYKIGLIPASLDQVIVGSAERTRSHELKAMFVLGVNDGIFPASSVEEGVLTDADRTVLNNNGIELASGSREKIFEEQYIIYKTLTSSSKKLRISWPVADHEGKGMRPSLIIYQMKKLFKNITEKSNVLDIDGEECANQLISSPMPTFREMVKVFRKRKNGEYIDPVWDIVDKWFCSRQEWLLKCDSMRKAMDFSNQTDDISEENTFKLYGNPIHSSVSKIEEYASCPFAYFVRYGLRAKERRIHAFAPLDAGNFLHEAIRRFSEAIENEGPKWREFDMAWCSEKVSEIIEDMLDKMRGGGIAASKRYSTLVRRLKKVLARALWLISEHIKRGSFDPVGYEIDFSDSGKYPPILIELENGRIIKLTGRIDRADSSITKNGDYLRIVDYKSGGKDFVLSDVFYGLQIQLVTYMNALWTQGEKIPVKTGDEPEIAKSTDLRPGGMLYFKLDDPFISSAKFMSDSEIEAEIIKKLKMKGILLADVELIKGMDRDISGHSSIVPAALNKNGELSKNSSVATYDQFVLLRNYVNRLLKKLCSEIVSGNVAIKPYMKDKKKACEFCSYSSVCQFDTQIRDNEYNFMNKMDDEQTWQMIGKYCKTD
ncbi:MAG: helicase-exonuclease AddAB subunit AddB, partial [Eubacteriales bacterium]|nr:helicase-exonuclease AddAB subunit AddB [Eubacteriales bacterium]